MGSIQAVNLPSSLLRFEGENVRSFRDSFELTLLSTRLAESGVTRNVRWNDRGAKVGVLPAACVFGANASGKTNVLRAMADLRAAVLNSFRSGDPDTPIPRSPFRLDEASALRPTRLSVDIVVDGVRHEYGFVFNDTRFTEEWAYSYPNGKQTLLFERNELELNHGTRERSVGRSVAQLLRPNALYLSTAGAAGHKLLLPLYRWFSKNLVFAGASNRGLRHARTISLLQDPGSKRQVLDLLQVADLGIVDARVEQPDPEFVERMTRAVRILQGKEGDPESNDADVALDGLGALRLSHRGSAGFAEIESSDESLGTVVWLGLLGPMLDALRDGSVLLADELDSSLHPRLVSEIVRLFQNPETNPQGAQLLSNAFDTALLGDSTSSRVLGRDQIWFSEKAADGATSLQALADFAPRKEEDIAGRYLRGLYGAVPIVDRHEFARAVELVNR